MRTYEVTLTGTQPLLMHNDDIEWADLMDAWKLDKDNRKQSKAGDDRTPAFRWIGSLYHNEEGEVIIPTANIMRVIMEGGASVLVPGGQRGKTFKAQSQSGIMPRAIGWPIQVNGHDVPFKPIEALMQEPDFKVHQQRVKEMGFTLFLKRARIGASKHIRVRPQFESWSARGEIVVIDEQITTEILMDILEIAGKYKGLGDWRPSSKTPGTYGMFEAQVEEL